MIPHKEIESRIIEIRGQKIIIDSDVALLYGVETKHINQAVRNNPERFPEGFIMALTSEEKTEVVKNFDHLAGVKFSKVNPKAFTEQGLYMLATILKSQKAVETTIEIIKTFAQLREVTRAVIEIVKDPENEPKQHSLLNKAGEMISKLITPAVDDLEVIETETTYKLNLLATLEFSKKTKRAKKKN